MVTYLEDFESGDLGDTVVVAEPLLSYGLLYSTVARDGAQGAEPDPVTVGDRTNGQIAAVPGYLPDPTTWRASWWFSSNGGSQYHGVSIVDDPATEAFGTVGFIQYGRDTYLGGGAIPPDDDGALSFVRQVYVDDFDMEILEIIDPSPSGWYKVEFEMSSAGCDVRLYDSTETLLFTSSNIVTLIPPGESVNVAIAEVWTTPEGQAFIDTFTFSTGDEGRLKVLTEDGWKFMAPEFDENDGFGVGKIYSGTEWILL